MNSSKIKSALRGHSAIVSAAILAVTAVSTPALAQASGDPASNDAQASPKDDATIVVTGSRLRHDNFNTPSPLNVITRDESVLAGARSTADVLQAATVTSGSSQINGAFLGFVSEGGAAANTVGLRGLGSSRTLVMLNGRRLAPSGTGSQLVSADLNVLPTAMVKQIEVLREGASSVYGSDAIAGVINIITDTKVNGITLDFHTDQPTEYGHAARDYRASITAGKVFDRGHITASFEFHDQNGLKVSDRPEFSCPRDLLFNPSTGAEVGSIDPNTGQLACFPYALGSGVGVASGYGIGINFTNGALNRLTYNNNNINSLRTVNGLNRVGPHPAQLDEHVISPIRTYTGYFNAAYETGMLGDAEIYGEALFTRRESHQDAAYQINISQAQLSPRIEIYGGSYAGTPLSAYGYPTSPFFPNSLASAGYNFFTPFIMPTRPYVSNQKVDYVRANGGLRGKLGLGDWRYDANFQYSHTNARYDLLLIEADRLSNSLRTVLAPANTPANLITRGVTGQLGAGNSYTCASNVSNGALVAGASCAPLNMYDPAILIGGQIPDNVFNYLFTPQVGRTTFTETTIALNADGTLLDLPAGPVRAAIGYEHRHNKIDDQPSASAQAGKLYNYSSAGRTIGADTVDEIYGEVNLPLLRDKPFAHDIQLNLSGRWTHYKSYGSDFTYHINGQWAPIEAIRFRANYGTSYRAPNLYEQFVADQTGFDGSGVDPCSGFASTFDPSTNRYKNCLAALSPILGANALNFLATSGPKRITRGGAGLLQAEKSTSWGLGVVINTPPSVADLSFAIDYWNVAVTDEVQILGNLILNRCYDADDFPNNRYCQLIAARFPTANPQRGNLDSYLNPYINVSRQTASGIDFDLRFAHDLLGGKFVARLQATRNIRQTFQTFETDPLTDYNGTLGIQGSGAGPKWVGDLDLKYTFPNEKVVVRWGIKYVGKQDSTELIGPYVAGLGLGPVNTDFIAEPYWEHSLSVQFKIQERFQLTVGANNLFNRKPPTVSQIPASNGLYTRIGNYFNSSNYDLIGRSVFMDFTAKF